MTFTFNVLIATIGRPSLQNMLDSLVNELNPNDCLTIVYDGHITPPLFDISHFKCKVIQFCEPTPLGFFGHGIRNKYASLLEKCDFIMHADDDDTYIENSFNELRKLIQSNNILYITKMTIGDRLIIPRDENIYVGNIGTPCGVIPYNLNLLGKWNHYYGGDGEFYTTIIKLSDHKFLNLILYRVNHSLL